MSLSFQESALVPMMLLHGLHSVPIDPAPNIIQDLLEHDETVD